MRFQKEAHTCLIRLIFFFFSSNDILFNFRQSTQKTARRLLLLVFTTTRHNVLFNTDTGDQLSAFKKFFSLHLQLEQVQRYWFEELENTFIVPARSHSLSADTLCVVCCAHSTETRRTLYICIENIVLLIAYMRVCLRNASAEKRLNITSMFYICIAFC